MLTSESRILTTHAGSLPRPAALAELHGRRSTGEAIDAAALRAAIEDATTATIAAQIEAGIDIGNDGEQARESFFTYVRHRMNGFGDTSQRALMRDLLEHPDFLELMIPRFARIKVNLMAAPAAISEVTYADTAELEAECALVANAPFPQTFMTAASPGIVAAAMENRYYASQEEYVRARRGRAADRVPVHRRSRAPAPDRRAGSRARAAHLVRRTSTRRVPRVDRARDQCDQRRARPASTPPTCDCTCAGATTKAPTHSTCRSRRSSRGSYDAHVGALVISMANARHAHEYALFAREPLPDGMMLVAGVIDTTSNYVEHEEVVADRLERIADAVGDPRRIIAGTDCGFDTSAGLGDVAPSLVWEKLRALRAGADIATNRLF